ncbi:MAG TPA: ABC transporter permease [Thermoanaerobaculia bacterium]|nr:ABC transporter permease [Thermoanaerobaculia bacterium]
MRLYPKRFRERYGADLVELHQRLADERAPGARRGAGRAVIGSLLGTLLDTLRDAPAAHLEELRRSRRRRIASRTGGALTAARRAPGGGWRDTVTALRALRRRPGFSLLVIATLGLGLGGLTAIWTVIGGVLLEPLPYAEPDRLYQLWGTEQGELQVAGTVAYLDVMDWREQSEAFSEVAAYDEWTPILTGAGEPVRLPAALVSANFLDLLGVEPAIGRFFLPSEDVDGQDRVVVLDFGLWQSRFGGDPAIVGRSILLNGRPHVVVGVTQASFEDPGLSGKSFEPPVLWRPLGYLGVEDDRLPNRGSSSYAAVGRLRERVSPEAAQAELGTIAARLESEYADTNQGRGVVMVPLAEQLVGDVRPSLLMLLGAMACLLAIALVNVASLMLGRATERSTEAAIRSSLGAGRWGLLRPAVSEGLLLGLAGGALGLVLAQPLLRTILGLAGADLPRADRVAIDGRTLLFTTAMSLVAGVLCGLLPAISSIRGALRGRLRSNASAGRAALRLRSALVAMQVALALVLLSGGAVLTSSFVNLLEVDAGIEPRGVLTFDLAPPSSRYPEPADLDRYYAEVLQRLSALPGVQAAGAINIVPLSGSFDGNGLAVPGHPSPDPDGEWSIQTRSVTPGYFEAIGTPILRGRGIEARDRGDAPPVVVINETAAERFWPGEDPVGEHVEIVGAEVEIVGVAADTKHLALDQEAPLQAYLSREQAVAAWQVRRQSIVLRTDADPLDPARGLVAAVRGEVWAIDPEIPLASLRSLQQVVDRTVSSDLLRTVITVAFAVLALLLSLVGIYGVTSYAVALRRRELAIRMALGARRRRVVGEVVRQAMRPAVIGLLLGIAGSWGVAAALRSFLFEVDGAPLAGPILAPLLVAVALVASFVPARRVTRIEPVAALREE